MFRLLILLPILLLLVLFALSNTQAVTLGLWPTGIAIAVPLSLAVLGGMAIAFLLGGAVVWVAELGQRRRARHAEQALRAAQAEILALQSRMQSALPISAMGPQGGVDSGAVERGG